jgi:molybdopterin converting factor small subunit
MKIQLIYMGRSYHAATDLPAELTLRTGATLDEALTTLMALPSARQRLSPACLVSVTGKHRGTIAEHEPLDLRDGDELVLIAPVAGG